MNVLPLKIQHEGWWEAVCASDVQERSLLVFTEELPYLKCPLHTVLKLTPVAYGKTALLSAYAAQDFGFSRELFIKQFLSYKCN